MRNVTIIGCGWLGEKLADVLRDRYCIFTTTTSISRYDKLNSKGYNPALVSFPQETTSHNMQLSQLTATDILIITVPFPQKESESHLAAKLNSLSSFIGNFSGQMFMMSSTSVYPDQPKDFHESDRTPESVNYERGMRDRYPQVNILRLGGLMGAERLLKNYTVSEVHLPVNHIHYSDVCAVVERMIDLQITSEVFNVVAPLHPSKQEVLMAQENKQMAGYSDACGRKISPAKLIRELDFRFRYPDPRKFHL